LASLAITPDRSRRVWERPLRAKKVSALAEDAPSGPILAVRVEDRGVKKALLEDDPETFFTTPHFDGYATVLIRLDRVSVEELNELIVEPGSAGPQKRLAKDYLEAD
jgi:hypothetical protein